MSRAYAGFVSGLTRNCRIRQIYIHFPEKLLIIYVTFRAIIKRRII